MKQWLLEALKMLLTYLAFLIIAFGLYYLLFKNLDLGIDFLAGGIILALFNFIVGITKYSVTRDFKKSSLASEKTLRATGILGIIIICSILFYYFVIALPKHNQQELMLKQNEISKLQEKLSADVNSIKEQTAESVKATPIDATAVQPVKNTSGAGTVSCITFYNEKIQGSRADCDLVESLNRRSEDMKNSIQPCLDRAKKKTDDCMSKAEKASNDCAYETGSDDCIDKYNSSADKCRKAYSSDAKECIEVEDQIKKLWKDSYK